MNGNDFVTSFVTEIAWNQLPAQDRVTAPETGAGSILFR